LRKQPIDLTSEADDNSSLDVSKMTMIGMIFCHFLIVCADLLVTACHTAFLVARPLMNWRSLLCDLFGFVDSLYAVRLLRTSRRLVECIALSRHFVSACPPSSYLQANPRDMAELSRPVWIHRLA
jgi:hypothetical protein